MKVCTDACIFGAWLANKFQNKPINTVLDIGAGTGLLSLMMAQKSRAIIDAVEIDESAAMQARENFEASVYAARLQLHKQDIRTFEKTAGYDLILSNPPFYQKDLKSDDSRKNIALHSQELSFEELIFSTEKLLSTDGFFAVLVPFQRKQHILAPIRKQQLFLNELVLFKQTEASPPFRCILLISRTETIPVESTIIIKTDGNYTAQFIDLLKDYYLYL